MPRTACQNKCPLQSTLTERWWKCAMLPRQNTWYSSYGIIQNEITPMFRNVPIDTMIAFSGPRVARPYLVLRVIVSPKQYGCSILCHPAIRKAMNLIVSLELEGTVPNSWGIAGGREFPLFRDRLGIEERCPKTDITYHCS